MPFADSEFNRLTRGYGLALLLVVGLHAGGWWWSQQRRVEAVTPAVVPQMVDVELVAASPEASPEPPAATLPSPPKAVPTPRPPEPKPKPVVKPPPKKVEPRPKAKPAPADTEVDDLAQRLKHLRETLGSEAAPAKASPAPARAAAKPSGGSVASSAKTTTARADHLHNPRPPYPAVARARNWEGVSQLRVYVLPNGSAGQVQLAGSSGHDVLDNAALAAVRQWRFVPAKRGDQAIASWVQFPIVWKLK